MHTRERRGRRFGPEPPSLAGKRRCWAAAAAALVLLGAIAVHAAESLSLPAPGRGAWQSLSFPGKDRITEYAAVVEDGHEAIRSYSECSASALILPSAGVDLDRTPILSWQWKVYRPLTLANERIRAGDDFAARVYVAFRFDRDHSGLGERIRHVAAEAIYGAELPGVALTYVWASREPKGQWWDNPFTSATKMISLGHGDMAGWRGESVDLLADFRNKTGGGDPPPVMFVALMTDTDDSCSAAGAYFADFLYRARAEQEDPQLSDAAQFEGNRLRHAADPCLGSV